MMQALAIALLASLLPAQDAIEREKLAGLLAQKAIESNDAAADQEARKIYEALLVDLQGPDRARVIDSYGVFLRERGDVEEAVRVFSRLDEREVTEARTPLPDHARYFFNAAETSVRRGDGRAAFHQYVTATRADGTFTEACERAVQLVREQPAAMIAQDVESVIGTRNVACGNALLLAAMTTSPSRPGSSGFDDAIRLVARLWTVRPPDEDRLAEWKKLLDEDGDCDRCEKKVGQIFKLVEDQPYRMVEDDEDLQKIASEWRAVNEDRLAFSALALAVGHQFALERKPREALARYVVSWRIDPANLEAATFAAGVLVSADEKFDDTKRIIADLANALAATSIEGTTAAERRERINLHITIGDLYAKRRAWSGGGESAIHWWERVLSELERLPDAERANVPVPELYARLGDAYEQIGNSSQAREYRLECAGEYIRSRNWPEAERALVRALAIDQPIPSETMAKIERVRVAILFGDFGLSGSHTPPRLAIRELAQMIRGTPPMTSSTSSSSPGVDMERMSSAAVDVRITDEVQQRINAYKRGSTSIVALAVQGVVYLFGPLQREELPDIIGVARRVRGVKNVIARRANT